MPIAYPIFIYPSKFERTDSAYVRFENNVVLAIESMWLAPPQINNHNGVEIWGTKGYGRLGPLQLLEWEDGEYVDQTEAVAPGLAATFRDQASVRTQREVFHFIDCVCGRAEPLITPREMWTDQAIVDAIYAGGMQFAAG